MCVCVCVCAGETDSGSDEDHVEAHLKATMMSRDLGEKLKKLPSPDSKKGLKEHPKGASNVLSPSQGPNAASKASVISPFPEPKKAHKSSSPSPDSKKGRNVVSPITESKKGRKASSPALKTRSASSPAPDARKSHEAALPDSSRAASPDPKKAHKATSAPDFPFPQKGEGKYKGKSKQEEKSLSSPDLQSPQTPPSSSSPTVKGETEEIVDPRGKSQLKERQKEKCVKEEAACKSKGSHKGIGNDTMVGSGKVDTPQTPSESSVEDFKEAGSTSRSKFSAATQKQEWSGSREKSRKQDRSKERDVERHRPSSSSRSTPPRLRTPDYPLDDATPDREEKLGKKARQHGHRYGSRHGKDRPLSPLLTITPTQILLWEEILLLPTPTQRRQKA